MSANGKTNAGAPPKAPVAVATAASGAAKGVSDDATTARLSMPENNGAKVTKPTVATQQKSGDDFKATLTVKDMVVWGLITMVPISPMAVYGGVFADSGGMPTLAFLIGFVAVLFSVFSFGIMIQHFPSSGSIFTYVSHVFGKLPGFIAGWLMLLQYLVSPAMVYLIAAIAIHSMLPDVPILALCFGFLIIVAIVSLIGMKTAMVVNKVALVAQLAILALFVVCGVMFVVQHPESANFSPTNLFNPAKFEFGGTMSAVSLAVMSYVGFGAIATLTQEAKDPKHGPSRAMMVMAILLCVLYALQCFIATCIDPSGAAFAGNTDNAFYAVAKMAAGPWLMIVCAVGVALAQGRRDTETFLVPMWLMVLCALTMALGTSLGGKRIIDTVGHEMVCLDARRGFAADCAGALCLLLCTLCGLPVSTTHTKTAAMLGVGSSVPGHPPDWKIARSIVLTWLLTFPGCGVIGYFMARIFLSFL